MKQNIRLTESDINRIVKESVKKMLRENDGTEYYRGIKLPYGCNVEKWGPKIDACLDEKGWPTEKVQYAIDDAFESMREGKENKIRRIVAETVKRMLTEGNVTTLGDYEINVAPSGSFVYFIKYYNDPRNRRDYVYSRRDKKWRDGSPNLKEYTIDQLISTLNGIGMKNDSEIKDMLKTTAVMPSQNQSKAMQGPSQDTRGQQPISREDKAREVASIINRGYRPEQLGVSYTERDIHNAIMMGLVDPKDVKKLWKDDMPRFF